VAKHGAHSCAPGGDDYHRIWINPNNPDIMLFAVDQGAIITVNGGKTFSSWYNQPTAQFYHVSTDNAFPYTVYGGQQETARWELHRAVTMAKLLFTTGILWVWKNMVM